VPTKTHLALLPFGFLLVSFSWCCYVALNNHAGARVHYELYTHIILISNYLSIDTLVVLFSCKLISSWYRLLFPMLHHHKNNATVCRQSLL
jgi:hypothetical protein